MREEVTVRRATREDVPSIVALYEQHNAPPGDDAFTEIDSDPKQLLLVAELEGEVVGTTHLTELRYLSFGGARAMLVEAVFVRESDRSRGIGAALMRFAIEEAKRRGCNRVTLTSNKARKDAHRFYERLGFVASHEGFKLYL